MTIHFVSVHPDQLDLLRSISSRIAIMERRIGKADRRNVEAKQRQLLILQKLQDMCPPASIPPTCRQDRSVILELSLMTCSISSLYKRQIPVDHGFLFFQLDKICQQ